MTARETIRRLASRLGSSGAGAVLLRGAGMFLVLHVLAAAAGFTVQAVLARNMGAEGYGIYVYALSWLMVGVPIGRLGLGTSSLRFVSEFSGKAQWGLLRGFRRFAMRTTLGVSLALAGLAAGLVALLGPTDSPEQTRTLWIACAALPIYALHQLWVSTLQALKRIGLSQLSGSVLPPVILGLGLAGFWLADAGALRPPIAMALSALALATALVFAALALGRVLPEAGRGAPIEERSRLWLRIALPLALVNLLHMLMERTGLLVVGSMLGPEQAGIYAPATRVVTIIAMALVAVNAWLAPFIAELHSQGRRDELQHYVRRGAQLVFAASLPLAVAVVIWGREILAIFGPEFTAGYRALAILAVGQLFDALMGPVGLLMSLTGQQATAARILLGVTAVHVALNLMLVPAFGIEGAALATAFSKIAWNGIFFFVVRRRVGVRSTVL